jgi:hypothetical protein
MPDHSAVQLLFGHNAMQPLFPHKQYMATWEHWTGVTLELRAGRCWMAAPDAQLQLQGVLMLDAVLC